MAISDPLAIEVSSDIKAKSPPGRGHQPASSSFWLTFDSYASFGPERWVFAAHPCGRRPCTYKAKEQFMQVQREEAELISSIMTSTECLTFAYATMLTNDEYLIGALTLAQSLRETVSAWPCVALITGDVSEHCKVVLQGHFAEVINVSAVASRSLEGLEMINRPDLFATLTKLQLWGLVRYQRILYLDADTLVLQNLDHLFGTEPADAFAAAPELGYPDCFNTGMMLLSPSMHILADLLEFARTQDSFDGGDQGLLNMYFGDGAVGAVIERCMSPQGSSKTVSSNAGYVLHRPWHKLSYIYNVQTNAAYRMYIAAVRRYEGLHKVVHFVGKNKPWHYAGAGPSGTTSHYSRFYTEMVHKWDSINARIPR